MRNNYNNNYDFCNCLSTIKANFSKSMNEHIPVYVFN